MDRGATARAAEFSAELHNLEQQLSGHAASEQMKTRDELRQRLGHEPDSRRP